LEAERKDGVRKDGKGWIRRCKEGKARWPLPAVISDGGWAPATEPPTDYQQQQQQPQQEELRGLSLCLSR